MMWKILSFISDKDDLVPSSFILNILMVALEGKASLESRSKCLEGIYIHHSDLQKFFTYA